MAITFTVGTSSRDYSTLQAAWNATAATWVDDYIFELYNDSEFTAGLVCSGKTVGSFRLTIRPATGQGFRDNSNKTTNALRYNASNGVGIRAGVFLGGVIDIQQTMRLTLDGLQIKNTDSGGWPVKVSSGSPLITLTANFAETNGAGGLGDFSNASTGAFYNNIVVCTSNTATGIRLNDLQPARGNTVVYIGSGTSSGTGIVGNWGACLSNSNAVFGFTTAHGTANGGSWSGSSGNNATDLSSTGAGGSGNVTSLTFANQFTAVGTAGSEDLRLKAGNSLSGAGVANANTTPDILGQTRASPPAIGAVEPIASVPAAPTGVTSGSVTATSATCSWTDASSDETSFDVQYAPSPYTSWPPLTGSPTAANATSLATGNVLTDGTSYKFRVRSTNSNGSSAWVESGVFTTTPLTKLRPVSDTTVGAWTSTGANLWSVLDEAAADDVDFISVTSGSTFKIKLQSSTNPGSTANHTVQIRMKGDGVSQLTLALVQGHPSETPIKSQTFTPTTSYAPYTMTLSSGEAATITNYGDLYLKGTSL